MTLYSPFFLLALFPISAAVYNAVKSNAKTYVLCVINLVFYFFAAERYFFLLPLLAAFVYWLSFVGKKGFYICIALLFVIRLFGINEIGVSFFILRSAAYIYDENKEKNFFKFFAYIMFFPCLHAGPLFQYSSCKKANADKIAYGLCLALCGAVKKLFFADTLYTAFDGFLLCDTTLSALMALVCYSLYIYFDFSGCSDMARGIAACMGFDVPKNFDFPYMARSVSEFFRRWHITLGRWLFKYIYIPLGGSKKGTARTLISLLCVWLFSALWHGTTLAYLLWGCWFFCFLALEKLGLKLGRVGVLSAVLFGWVFFFSKTPSEAFSFFTRLFAVGDTLLYSRADIYNSIRYAPFVILGAFCATPIMHNLLTAMYNKAKPLAYVLAICSFVFVISCLSVGGHAPFLYATF